MTESVSLTVIGMKCGGCEANVTSKLKAIDGVLSVNASSKNNEVNVEFDAEKTNPEAVSKLSGECSLGVFPFLKSCSPPRVGKAFLKHIDLEKIL